MGWEVGGSSSEPLYDMCYINLSNVAGQMVSKKAVHGWARVGGGKDGY